MRVEYIFVIQDKNEFEEEKWRRKKTRNLLGDHQPNPWKCLGESDLSQMRSIC